MPGRPAHSLADRLVEIELDPASIGTAHAFLAVEREVAMRDLIAENRFVPAGRSGTFRLRLSMVDRKLVLDIADADEQPVARHILSLRPLARVVKDYFLICESYYAATRTLPPSQVEAIDMGRRGVHNEGAEALQARLKGKVDLDFPTARRLFTLVCALSWKGLD